ncbi:hypothetical protein KDI_41060 [Dictyobacter arantiisoli]|uniref:Uncharacterized protein n=2 Tax=Dictyobacter arantiisoli TaxID=2014874 RepID=A0A5A5TGU9_9CHLR|nr:hypothetical protein KDI_41060 [Dictyobacter arantiisoli]
MEYSTTDQPFKEPFRFQTQQQKSLYTKLKLLGPGPATFYREACSLITPPQRFESTTHLVAHLLREIESSVRRVLLPYDYVPPDACQVCENRPETHAKQIEAITQSLKLDKGIQKKWKEIATRNKTFNGLAAMAHREDLSYPREIDSSFQLLVNTFEEVFISILAAFEKQSTHIFALLNTLLLKEAPSKKDLSHLKNTIPHNDTTHRYFFERLQSPGWLDPLYQTGFFTPPPSKEWNEELGRFIFSLWPPAQYLLRIVSIESTQQTILTIMQEVSDTDNPFVQRTILQIVQTFPASLAAKLVPTIQKWIQAELIQSIEFTQISNLINHLAQGKESKTAIALTESCFAVLRHRESYTESWDYEKILSTNTPLLIKHSAIKTLAMLCHRLEVEVYENHIRFRNVQESDEERLQKEAQEASTKSWQYIIGNARNKFLPGMHDLLNLLVVTLWQAAEQAVQEQIIPIDTVVSLLEEHPGRIFRRIILYLLSRIPQDSLEAVKLYLMDRALFDDSDVRYEYGLLAQTGYSLLSDTEQKQWLEWIETGPDCPSYQEQYEKYYHKQPDDDLVQQYVRVWQRDWLREIEDGLKDNWKERYDALVTELGPTEPEEDFPIITWGSPAREPLIEELRSMSIDQILSYLQEWQPSGDFMSPSREELGRLLTGIISTDPEPFAEQANLFQGYNPIYISAVVQGFTEAIRNRRTFDWENVLNLCEWVINQRYTLAEDGVTIIYDPQWAWSSQMVANLLLGATEAQSPIIPISLSAKIWDIMKPLTDDPDPAQEDEVDEEGHDSAMEYATRAINSIRGIALHAVVNYALWQKRQDKHEEGEEDFHNFKAMPEVQAVLERHLDTHIDASLAVRSVYAQRLANLVALDVQWIADHLMNLFPQEVDQETLRVVTWNTYIIFCEPYNNVLALLREEYTTAIERLGITKQSRSITENPDYRLGVHLIRFYWSGLISLNSPESLLTHFFMEASDVLRGQILAFIGRVFYETGETIPSEVIERSQQLWNWRLSEAQKAPSITEYTHELAAFGWWFRTDICPDEWGLHQLEAALVLAGYVELSYAVVERLAKLVEPYPTQVLICLEFLIKGDTMMWTTSTWEKTVRHILTYALQQKIDETQRRAKSLISTLALHGITDFLNLLPN